MTTTTESARVIEARALSKRYGDKVAVDTLSFTVAPGQVTGFLGPNGAGKSTTMRLLLGLDRPDRGTATIGGGPYRDLPRPLCTVGALLEAKAVHKGRSAYNHLLCLAQTQHLPRRRVDEVIDLVGLRGVRHKRAGGFSLGMAQRLGIAAALLGDPSVLLLDEPVNGLDPEGIVWIRTLMKHLASEGRTVFVSSHLIVIGRGRLIADCPTEEFVTRGAKQSVRVSSPDARTLAGLLAAHGADVEPDGVGVLVVAGMPAPRIAELAAQQGLVLYELTPQRASLEDAFMALTHGSVEFDGADR